jgi:hypothetical protein
MPPLETSASATEADLIFVYAGREDRKSYGLDLYRKGRAPALLLSVGRYEVRRFAELPLPAPVDLRRIAANVEPPQRHFFVGFSANGSSVERIRLGRFGTLGETQALRAWLDHRQGIRRISVVSSQAHRLRVELCCKKLLPSSIHVSFLPVPTGLISTWSQGRHESENSARYFFSEFGKLLVYRLLLLWPRLFKSNSIDS